MHVKRKGVLSQIHRYEVKRALSEGKTPGEITPSYILHTRAFGIHLPCKKDYKVMVLYM
jgi:hypothetical protein